MPELAAVRRMGVVGEDGVHMSEDMCRSTAVALCFRLAEADVRMVGERESSGDGEEKWLMKNDDLWNRQRSAYILFA